MIKNLHLVQSDPSKRGSIREYALEEYKKFYKKDFKIYYWSSEIVDTLISNIPFLKSCKEKKMYELVDSYILAAVVNEMGGIGFGSDVVPLCEFDESMFEHNFFVRNTMARGTFVDLGCCIYSEPNNEILSNYVSYIRNIKENTDSPLIYSQIEDTLNNLIFSYGVDSSTLLTEDIFIEDKNLSIYNARQFGFYDASSNSIIKGDKEVKLVHTHKNYNKDKYDEKMSLYYMILNDDTNKDKVIEGIKDFSRLDTTNDIHRSCITLIINTSKPYVDECIKELKSIISYNGKKFYKVMCLNAGMDNIEAIKMLPDLLGPTFHNLEICRNMLFGAGRLTNPVGSPWAVPEV